MYVPLDPQEKKASFSLFKVHDMIRTMNLLFESHDTHDIIHTICLLFEYQ
ncbi:unnamed protein product [Coffea canephora]|uniref:DH200=94 genomic scaffold, scaffold_3530 n=1 Tax=Coffea canephora TaxID=49390 RepID=A0A068VKW6_COFCA|nr:unnamed protein product [Coffea canephora]